METYGSGRAAGVDLEGQCQLTWRQGIKHDCAGVMELTVSDAGLFNKNGEPVSIEPDLLYPLVKSSHFKQPLITSFTRKVLVTQQHPGQDTAWIEQQLPLTWAYLQEHKERFAARRSSIYRRAPDFAIFGTGPYSFAPFKVGLSGFYKTPLFAVLSSDKPVMTDDTCYFLSFDYYELAYTAMVLLNSTMVRSWLLGEAFLDSKRPWTVKLLSRLDLGRALQASSLQQLSAAEQLLGLTPRITAGHIEQLAAHLSAQQR